MFESSFENIEETLKNVSKKLFRMLIIVGILSLVIGFIKIMICWSHEVTYASDDELFVASIIFILDVLSSAYPITESIDGYAGRQMVLGGIYCLFASLGTFPLYGFGVLLEEIRNIKKEITKPHENDSTDV